MGKDEVEKSNQLNLTVVALVALVAIVGLVALVMNAGKISTGSQLANAQESESENIVGNAKADPWKQKVYNDCRRGGGSVSYCGDVAERVK